MKNVKKRNKKGQVLIYLFAIGLLFFFVGLAITPALNEVITDTTNGDQMNCSATDLTKEEKSTCTSIELMQPYFIGIIFGLSALIIGRVVM